MYLLIFILFVVGYLAIAFEHDLKIDKAATAILMGVLCWTALVIGGAEIFPSMDSAAASLHIEQSLMYHLGETSGILFFLLGAMTIVELIDAHDGFDVITNKIETVSRVKLMWILCILTFILSAILDNLTTSIVMAALIRKLMTDKKDIWLFGGLIIVAANAGGAWSPIGDVTTIMLWVGGQVSAPAVISNLFIPSLLSLIVPLILISFRLQGEVSRGLKTEEGEEGGQEVSNLEQHIILYLGVAALLFVPVFKSLTNLPPFMGVLLGLSVLWIVTDVLHRDRLYDHRKPISIVAVLQKVDTTSILFFLGILIAVASLQTAGHLTQMAEFLDQRIGNIYIIDSVIGILSAVVDNVPLVAGAIGMYSLEVYPMDSTFWELLAYCAGTGGSLLIIGSAAGVAIMGILQIDFIWYFRNITFYALVGYLVGIGSYVLLN